VRGGGHWAARLTASGVARWLRGRGPHASRGSRETGGRVRVGGRMGKSLGGLGDDSPGPEFGESRVFRPRRGREGGAVEVGGFLEPSLKSKRSTWGSWTEPSGRENGELRANRQRRTANRTFCLSDPHPCGPLAVRPKSLASQRLVGPPHAQFPRTASSWLGAVQGPRTYRGSLWGGWGCARRAAPERGT